MKTKKSNRKKLWTRIGIIAVIALILAILFNNVSGSTQPIKDAADRFKAAADWELTAEQVEPPRFYCFGDVRCPSLFKSWTSKTDVRQNDLEKILSNSGFVFPIDGTCLKRQNESGTVPLCTAQGTHNNFEVTISLISARGSTYGDTITLSIE